VDDYVICFEEFEGFTGFDDTALVKAFKEGLAPQILLCCYGLETKRNLGCFIEIM
jgi:hypothetical protein